MSRLSYAVVCALAACVGLCAGCGASRVSLAEGPRSYTASDYDGIYGRWTRSADEFDFGRLGEILHCTATFESWEYRWAYVTRYAHDHSMTEEERAIALQESLADAGERHRFFVTLSTPRFREGNITERESDWRVLLVDPSGRQVEPVEIVRVRRPSAAERHYFPSISRQRHTFRIAFPVSRDDGTPTVPRDADHVLLRFAGAEGVVDLRWEFEQN